MEPPTIQRGVVAVVHSADRFLVIRRAQSVRAPGTYCFPGGGIEPGESEPAALRRELHEELRVAIEPLRPLWRSVTPWHVALSWWLCRLPAGAVVSPQPAEVESVHWLTAGELRALPELLASNRDFLDAWQGGQFTVE